MSLFVLFRLPISILLLLGFAVSYVWQEPGGVGFGLLGYGFLALLVGLIIWRVLKAREYRRAEEIERHSTN
jgi:hypothetical protein